MTPRFTIEVWPHGWLLCGAGGSIPITALSECQKLFPSGAVMPPGIPHHFRASSRRDVVICVATAKAGAKWEAEINESLFKLPPEDRWWRSLDTGTSSIAIFAVFCEERLRFAATEAGHRSTPRDSADFGRCRRLLDRFPEWRSRLGEVAAAYPETKWPALVARWQELENATDDQVTEVLAKL